MSVIFHLQLAMKLAPERKKFIEVIGGTGDVNSDMEKFCNQFSPYLQKNHDFLVCFLLLFYNRNFLIKGNYIKIKVMRDN